MINKKVDFIFTFTVENANPNGDPLAANMPRTDVNGFGEVSDVCIKRKIRNRMQDMGEEIFVKSSNRADDGFTSLQKRFESVFKKNDDDAMIEDEACKRWMDVRAFGQVITYYNKSIGIRGPVSITIARSLDPITVNTMQITKSVNGMEATKGKGRSSDTIGSKHYVDFGVYLASGSVNVFFSEKTGFDDHDLSVLKEAIQTLFINDASSARPDGSMEIKDIFWFEHSSKVGDVSSAKIRQLVEWDELEIDNIKPKYKDYKIHLKEDKLKEYMEKGLKYEHLEGI